MQGVGKGCTGIDPERQMERRGQAATAVWDEEVHNHFRQRCRGCRRGQTQWQMAYRDRRS